MYSNEVADMLKHMSTYYEIYCYLGEHKKATAEELKNYLMEECGKPESTARSNINGLISGQGLIKVSEGYIQLDKSIVFDFEDNLDGIFQWSSSDGRANEMRILKEHLEKQYDKNADLQLEIYEHLEEIKKLHKFYKNHIARLDEKIYQLQHQLLQQELTQKTLVLSSLEIGPEQDGLFKDEQFPFADRHPSIDEKTMLMDSFLEIIPDDEVVKELDPDKDIPGFELCKSNLLARNIYSMFSRFFKEKVLENLGLYKDYQKRRNPMKNVISVDKILAMTDITNAEKMALYVTCCDDLSEAKAELLHNAAARGLDAELVIRLLEGHEVTEETKRRFWLALDMISQNGEYYTRDKFARELIEQKWYIKAVYCGKLQKFQLVPVNEIEFIKDLQSMNAGYVPSSLDVDIDKLLEKNVRGKKELDESLVYDDYDDKDEGDENEDDEYDLDEDDEEEDF